MMPLLITVEQLLKSAYSELNNLCGKRMIFGWAPHTIHADALKLSVEHNDNCGDHVVRAALDTTIDTTDDPKHT
jgi:hypothetical protein